MTVSPFDSIRRKQQKVIGNGSSDYNNYNTRYNSSSDYEDRPDSSVYDNIAEVTVSTTSVIAKGITKSVGKTAKVVGDVRRASKMRALQEAKVFNTIVAETLTELINRKERHLSHVANIANLERASLYLSHEKVTEEIQSLPKEVLNNLIIMKKNFEQKKIKLDQQKKYYESIKSLYELYTLRVAGSQDTIVPILDVWKEDIQEVSLEVSEEITKYIKYRNLHSEYSDLLLDLKLSTVLDKRPQMKNTRPLKQILETKLGNKKMLHQALKMITFTRIEENLDIKEFEYSAVKNSSFETLGMVQNPNETIESNLDIEENVIKVPPLTETQKSEVDEKPIDEDYRVEDELLEKEQQEKNKDEIDLLDELSEGPKGDKPNNDEKKLEIDSGLDIFGGESVEEEIKLDEEDLGEEEITVGNKLNPDDALEQMAVNVNNLIIEGHFETKGQVIAKLMEKLKM